MEIDYEVIRKAVNNAQLIHNEEEIKVGNLTHLISLLSEEWPISAKWTFPSPFNQINGAAIELSKSIPKEFRKVLLFHEIAEITHRYDLSTGSFRDIPEEAHLIARYLEVRYARESLSKYNFLQYLDYFYKNKTY